MMSVWLSEPAGPGTVGEQCLVIVFEATSEHLTI